MPDQNWGTGLDLTWGELFGGNGTWGEYGPQGEIPPVGNEGGEGANQSPFKYYAYDLFTRKVVDEVPFSTFKYSPLINRAGGWSATINAKHPKADPAIFSKGRTAIVVIDRGEPRFAGIVWSTPETPDGVLQVGGADIWDYFAHRNIRTSNVGPYTQVDQFSIVRDMLTKAQSGIRESVGLTPRYTAVSGVKRNRVYDPVERKPYGQAIQELAEVDDGFEFTTTPAWSNGQLIMYLDLAYPRLGRDTDIVWYLGKTVVLAGNLEDDGGTRANLVDAIGADKLIGFAINSPVDTLRLEASTSYTDVKVLATLVDHSNGDLARLDQDQQSMKVAIKDLDQFGLGIWSLGDSVRVVREEKPDEPQSYHQVDDMYRIQGYEASVDVNGQLQLTVDLVLGLNNLAKPRPTPRQRAAAQQAAIDKRLTQLEKVH